jgi:hypothetical protein
MPSTIVMAARAELENEAFVQAIVHIEEKWIDRIRASALDATEDREYAYRMLRVLADFVDELKAMTSDDAHDRGRAQAQQMMR